MIRRLADVWPQESSAQVFLCLEDGRGGQMVWPYKGLANSEEGHAILEQLGMAMIRDTIKTGPLRYIYMDKKQAAAAKPVRVDIGTQLTLSIN